MVTKEEPTPHDGIAARTARAASGTVKDTIPDVLKHDEATTRATDPLGSLGAANEPPPSDAAESAPAANQSDTPPPKKVFDPWRFGAITMPPELLQSLHEGPREQVPPEQFRALIAGETAEDGEEVSPGRDPATYQQGWGSTTSEQFARAGIEDQRKATELPTERLPRVIAAERQRKQRRLVVGVAGVSFMLLGFTWWALSHGPERAPGMATPGDGATAAPNSAPMVELPPAVPPIATGAVRAAPPPAPAVATTNAGVGSNAAQRAPESNPSAHDNSAPSKTPTTPRAVPPVSQVARAKPQPTQPAEASAPSIEPTVSKPKNPDPESVFDTPLIHNPKRKSSDD
jgi:hypothetical protein